VDSAADRGAELAGPLDLRPRTLDGTDELGATSFRALSMARISLLVSSAWFLRLRSHRSNDGYACWIRRRLVGPRHQFLLVNAFLSFRGSPALRSRRFGPAWQSNFGADHYRWAGYRLARAQVLKSKRWNSWLARDRRRFSPAHHGGTSAAQILQPILIQATIGMAAPFRGSS